MTATGVAAVIRCADLTRFVLATVNSLVRQSRRLEEIILVTDSLTPAATRTWLEAAAGARRWTTVHSEDPAIAAVLNAGIGASSSDYILLMDAGDRVDPEAVELVAAELERNEAADLVTTATMLLGPGNRREVIPAPGHQPVDMCGQSVVLPGASLIRRSAWQTAGGLDLEAGAFAVYEFQLRTAAAGRATVAVPRPLLTTVWRPDALYARGWGDDQESTAVEHVSKRHRALFDDCVVEALYGREQILQTLAEQYRTLLERYRGTQAEIVQLQPDPQLAVRSESAEPQRALEFGDLRRVSPVARDWGYSRGTPIDRFYIERFLDLQAGDIKGVVLEVQEGDYTQRFGGSRVTRSDVVDIDAANPRATIVSDLRCAANIPSETYDCVLLTQTAHVIDDLASVIAECSRVLKPGGVLLATLPAASRVSVEYGHEGDFWRVTAAGARQMFEEVFPPASIDARAHGNVLVNLAFLHGLGCHELSSEEFETDDPYYPLIVTVRAVKPPTGPTTLPGTRHSVAIGEPTPSTTGTVLLYHRVASPSSDVHGLAVAPDQFRRQMMLLRSQCHVLPLADLIETSLAGTAPANAVAVTFDDGYVDNLEVAAPILQALGIPATFFITTERLDHQLEFWWDILERCLLSASEDRPPVLELELQGGPMRLDTHSAEGRLAAHWDLYRALVTMPADERDQIIANLQEWSPLGGSQLASARRMNAQQVMTLADMPGHAIGAHSVRHLLLPSQPLAVQRVEVDESKRTLESLLGRPVQAFAYPFGAMSDASVEAVRQAEFTFALAAVQDAGAEPSDRWRFPRLEVTPKVSACFGEVLFVNRMLS